MHQTVCWPDVERLRPCCPSQEREVLKRHGIRVETAAIKECYGAEDGELAGLVLDDGRRVPVR